MTAQTVVFRLPSETIERAGEPALGESLVSNGQEQIQTQEKGQWWASSRERSCSTLVELAERDAEARVVLLVPGEWVVLRALRLPGRRRAVWRQALAFALEDELADPIEALRFVLGPSLGDGHVGAAVIREALIHPWEIDCHRAGLKISSIVPDVLCLPLPESGWSVFVDGERAMVRTGRCTGFVCSSALLSDLLSLALAQSETRPRTLVCWGAEALPMTEDIALEHHRACDLAALLDDPLALASPIDLQRSAAAQESTLGDYWRAVRWVAGLGVVYLTLMLARQGLELYRLDAAHAAVQQEIRQVFERALPTARRMVNPRVQIENELDRLDVDAYRDPPFFRYLAMAGEGLRQHPGVTIASLDYRDGRLDVRLTSDRLERIDSLSRTLRSTPGDITIDWETSMRDQQVETRLRLESAAP